MPTGKVLLREAVDLRKEPSGTNFVLDGIIADTRFIAHTFSPHRPMDTARIAVVGAGVMGLSTALCLSKLVPRCSITVISDKFSPDTTSDVAAGILIPHVYPGERDFRSSLRHGRRQVERCQQNSVGKDSRMYT